MQLVGRYGGVPAARGAAGADPVSAGGPRPPVQASIVQYSRVYPAVQAVPGLPQVAGRGGAATLVATPQFPAQVPLPSSSGRWDR